MTQQPEYKTIRQWFEELPEPYRSQAIENCDVLDSYTISQTESLIIGFVWNNTPQRHDYWHDLHQSLLYESK